MPQPIRLLIAEDHALFGQGLRRVLSLEADFEVVAEVKDGEAAIDSTLALRPDVVLMDINMPKVNGLQATQQIKALWDEARVIILTAYDDEEQMFFAMRYGAAAYFSKDVAPDELIAAIRTVCQGKYVVSGRVLDEAKLIEWLLAWYNQHVTYTNDGEETLMPLSPREMEVLAYIVQGASNKVIAIGLGISQQTVKNHMTSIFRKLGVSDRTEAAIVALRRGWIRLQDTGKLSEESL
jgi:DNA-binding NarL/FixJ family response regulator